MRRSGRRWGIFSDVHANRPALDAVLEDIARVGVDRHLCLGDLVGYGPHPREVVERVRALGCPVVVGNHDLAAIGRLDTSDFNPFARAAVDWTASRLSEDDRRYLAALPMTWADGAVSAVHATHDEPEEFLYLQSLEHARDLLLDQERFLVVFGHTHVPMTFALSGDRVGVSSERRVDLSDVDRALVNVGSVGQPRDEDARASWVLFDERRRTLEIRRVPYDYEPVVEAILAAGLPSILGERLRFGV
ncbi:MAG: metallophosphoesterase family protein [Planctomycetota bacterium JB042]